MSQRRNNNSRNQFHSRNWSAFPMRISCQSITICITTRAIGFGTAHVFSALARLTNVPQEGNIYQLYRVGLATLEYKAFISGNLQEFHEFFSSVEHITMLPDQITSIINAVGKVKISQRCYIPKFAEDNIIENQQTFIPQAEHITLSNLRRVVESLASADTPSEYRRRFYDNNPIPGAIWTVENDVPTLTNPDEIMPVNYTSTNLRADMLEIQAKMYRLQYKAPGFFTEPLNKTSDGGKAMLVCNQQETLRISDRGQNQELDDYYLRLHIEGDVSEFYTSHNLTDREWIEGSWCLLGEQPTSPLLIYPAYVSRDPRCCSHFSYLNYQLVRNVMISYY